jgi:hypothetical protein
MTSVVGLSESSKYAESLRTNLIADLFDGEEVDFDEDKHQQGYDIEDFIGSTTELQDVEADLDAFAEHEFLKGILERGQVSLVLGPFFASVHHAP